MPKDKFDEFVDKLQKEIIDQEIKDFNERIVELFHNPANWGKPSENEITVSNEYQGPCGDTMQFFLKIKDGIIKKANFITDGCGASVAAGSQTTLLIEGRVLEYAEDLNPGDIDNALLNLPDEHKHCAELAISTLKGLIEKYKNKKS